MITAVPEPDIFQLASELTQVWRANDFHGLSKVVSRFQEVRKQLVPDWKIASLMHHMPEWEPFPAAGIPKVVGRELVSQLDTATFSLITPLTEMYNTVLARKCTHGPTAMLRAVGQSMMPVDELIADLAACNDLKTQMRVLNQWFYRVNESTTHEVVQLFKGSDAVRALVSECAAYRFLTEAIVDRDPSIHLSKFDAPRVLAEQLSSAAMAGSGLVYRFTDVFGALCARGGIEINDEVFSRNVTENRILTGMARSEVTNSRSLTRIAAGCRSSCFDHDGAILRTSPHASYMSLFDDDDDFRQRHWGFAWFDPNAFAFFKHPSGVPVMGLAQRLGETIDPMTGEPVEFAPQRHTRMGCPALSHRGVQDLNELLAAVISHNVVRKQLIQYTAADVRIDLTDLRPTAELMGQFEVRVEEPVTSPLRPVDAAT